LLASLAGLSNDNEEEDDDEEQDEDEDKDDHHFVLCTLYFVLCTKQTCSVRSHIAPMPSS
jgi:hypothetical protein